MPGGVDINEIERAMRRCRYLGMLLWTLVFWATIGLAMVYALKGSINLTLSTFMIMLLIMAVRLEVLEEQYRVLLYLSELERKIDGLGDRYERR